MLTPSQLDDVTRAVWEATLGEELLAVGPAADPPAPLTGCVHLSGEWAGSVLLELPPSVARRAAAAMLELAVDGTTDEDLADAVCELTNMIGGNVKALVPGVNSLSLPHVLAGVDLERVHARCRPVHVGCYEAAGGLIRVTVLRRAEDSARAPGRRAK